MNREITKNKLEIEADTNSLPKLNKELVCSGVEITNITDNGIQKYKNLNHILKTFSFTQ